MNYSIIIPHRNRLFHLQLCVYSLLRSARGCDVDDKEFEILIVENGSTYAPLLTGGAVRVINDIRPMVTFNKPKLQNRGIEEAEGDVLAFVDADAIVGPKWFETLKWLPQSPGTTKVCYEVRMMPSCISRQAGCCNSDVMEYAERVFYNPGAWTTHKKGFDARVHPDMPESQWGQFQCPADNILPHFGNSQFSITREKLGDLRFNEEYEGAGYEDIWMNREIWRKYGLEYRTIEATEPAYNMLHLAHPRDEKNMPGWREREYLNRNKRRYDRT